MDGQHKEPASESGAPPPTQSGGGWLPRRVDLQEAVVETTELDWAGAKAGSISGARLTLRPEGASEDHETSGDPGAWSISAEGGLLQETGLPDLNITSAKLRYHRPSLYIVDSQFKGKDSGTLSMSGEINFERSLALDIKLNSVPIAPLLPLDWQKRLDGNLSGDIRLRSQMPMMGAPDMEGTVNLAQGKLEALPVLDQIATFTRSQQFRTLTLSAVSADFKRATTKLTVSRFVAESEGLIRIEGAFVVEDSNIEGSFQVGVTPRSLQWLPGSQGKVFTVSREGYLWTPVHLSGPLRNPTEDLSPRLLAAAEGSVLDKVQDTIKDPVGALKDPARALKDPRISS